MTMSIIAAKKHPLTTMAIYCSEEQRHAIQQARRAYVPPRKNKMALFLLRTFGLKNCH